MAVGAQGAAPVGTRRERLRAMMREEILTAARKILQDEGVKGLAMRPLGRAVGVTATTLYDYFPSKDAVLNALYVQAASRLLAAFDEAIIGSRPGRGRMRAIALAYRRFALDHPDLYFLLFDRIDASYRPGEEEITCGVAINLKVVEVAREALEVGDLRPGDPATISNAMWAMAHGHVTLEIGGFMEKCGLGLAGDMYASNLDALFEGLGPVAALSTEQPAPAPER